ncbi:hypothetical protein K1T35_48575 (plasmid) [Pseudonocardia sp. DSM 110487]|uniref:hypothetical protein n=1 Tax=Pseudonocardia sp. DSM 110487 TaxID=2865833 RepID=UPI001C6995B0|nr:hypothetical protein [Pseudonocardia sp. DSM 110487]QYN41204.1 hypothetical protein K1T35_48575 [Pseudonocardia sp. DSM 110487]
MPPKKWPIEQLAPTSRYRAGHRDAVSRAGHAADTTGWRRRLAQIEVDDITLALLVSAVRASGDLRDAAERCGLTVQKVYGRMAWDARFSEQLELALAEACSGGEHCGTVRGYRSGGRCAACRTAKRLDRGPRRPT